MKRYAMLLLMLAVLFTGCQRLKPATTLKIATTTSIYDSGFLDFVFPPFEDDYGIKLNFISVGSGQAVKMFKNKDVDGIIIHERSFLDELLQEKYINGYTPLVYNHFMLVGPKDARNLFEDAGSIQEAFLIIKNNNLPFVSRADNSATYIRELEIWDLAGTQPDFDGYIKSGQGMGMSLNLANEKRAFILTDEATFYKMKDKLDSLDVIYQGPDEEVLMNVYYFALSSAREEAPVFEKFFKGSKFRALVEGFNQKYFKNPVYKLCE
nr:MAG: tungsten ABC transporter permease [Caldicoprobacter oshimai]